MTASTAEMVRTSSMVATTKIPCLGETATIRFTVDQAMTFCAVVQETIFCSAKMVMTSCAVNLEMISFSVGQVTIY